LQAVCLTDSPLIALGSPEVAHRLRGRDVAALADEPLLGVAALWQRWFEMNGVRTRVNPVAAFNDAGLLLQAAEQNLGIALSREILAADALRDGRLVRLSATAMHENEADAYWLAFSPRLAEWPPLVALRDWLFDELAVSQRALNASGYRVAVATDARAPAGPAPPVVRTGAHARAKRAAPARRRAR
jgi:LysR family glycine cleavage system transcriptional activator